MRLSRKRRLARYLFWLMLVGALVTYWYLLIDGRAEMRPAVEIEMSDLRELSQSIPGAPPTDIVAYITAIDRKTGNFMVAGSGFQAPHVGSIGYAIEYAESPPVIIDTGMTEQTAIAQDVELFAAARRSELDRRIEEAETILLTGTGPFFASGLMGSADRRNPGRNSLESARLGAAQARTIVTAASDTVTSRKIVASLPDDRPAAIAPGVVSIPAPGYDAASRMVYVRLLSGRELLFTGENAPLSDAWKSQKPPARLVTDFFERRDRASIREWLKAIAELKRQAPDLIVVPGHDVAVLVREFDRDDQALGILRYGLGQPGVFAEPGSD